MEPIDYLKVLSQRWKIILVAPLIAVAAWWILLPSPSASPVKAAATGYTATATLLQTGASEPGVAFARLIALRGEVPRMVAEKLGEDPATAATLITSVTVSAEPESPILTVRAKADDPERAVLLADTFADSIVEYLMKRQDLSRTRQIESLEKQYQQLAKEAEAAAERAEDEPDDPLVRLEAQASQDALTGLYRQILGLRQQPPPQPTLEVMERAVAVPVKSGGVAVTTSGKTGLLAALGGGLIAGLVIALIVARLDTRPRSRADVQDAFGLPVLAEIPRLPATERHTNHIQLSRHPDGAVADGYRTLRSALMLLEPRPLDQVPRDTSRGKADALRQVILVTSAREGEGKTSTVVNLAAAFAELGRSVLVLDCDLRNPQCHRFLDVPLGSGIADLVGPGLEHLARQTVVPNVRLVQAGTGDPGHALLAVQMPMNVQEARSVADVVLVDSPPVLAGNEAMDVMAAVDAVVVVARSGRATADQIHRTRDVIGRVQVPVYGVALVASSSSGLPTLPPWGLGPSARSDARHRAQPAAEANTAGAGTTDASHHADVAGPAAAGNPAQAAEPNIATVTEARPARAAEDQPPPAAEETREEQPPPAAEATREEQPPPAAEATRRVDPDPAPESHSDPAPETHRDPVRDHPDPAPETRPDPVRDHPDPAPATRPDPVRDHPDPAPATNNGSRTADNRETRTQAGAADAVTVSRDKAIPRPNKKGKAGGSRKGHK